MVEKDTDALGHYGVKGMHWGVRKQEELTGREPGGHSKYSKSDDEKASIEEYKSILSKQPELTGLAASKNLQSNMEKFHNKADDPGPELPGSPKDEKREAKASKLDAMADEHDTQISELQSQLDATPPGLKTYLKRNALANEIEMRTEMRDDLRLDASRIRDGKLTSGQRKALIAAGVGAVVVGGMAYSSYKQGVKMKELETEALAGNVDAKLKLYQMHVTNAKVKTWMFGGYIRESSWDREEFELPEGHVFNRISTRDESSHGFRMGTYCTPDEKDFNRYVAGFRQEKGANAEFYHVTFTAKGPTRVPNLNTTIETLRETLSQERSGMEVSRAEALSYYQTMSGGSWNNSTSGKFFANLKAKGYTAIVDEMDAGVIGERPLVFFGEPNPKQARNLDTGEISVREKSVELMTKPPRKA